MTLISAGSTTHYSINYDDSLAAADGLTRAQQLLAVCEQDYNLMATWFPNLSLPFSLPITVNISPGPYASAGWGPPITLTPGNGSSLTVVRYLLVAEVVEMFMLAQKKGWFASDGTNEGEAGEGLSRVLSTEFLIARNLGWTLSGFDTARFWLNGTRGDFVNNIDQGDHAPDEKSGCATLFINYLSYQLGYNISKIIASGLFTGPGSTPSLAGLYKNLTGSSANPFPDFKALLDGAFPPGKPAAVPGPNPDNPFPLNVLRPEVPVSVRVFWQMNPGRNVVNLNWPAVSADSVVMVSASEYSSTSQKLPDGSHQRFVGAASVTVSNVTPHGPPFDPNHGVTFVVDVAWNAPLTICTDIALVNNAPESVVYVGPGIAANQLVSQAADARRATEQFEGRTIQTTIQAHADYRPPADGQDLTGSGMALTMHEATIPKGHTRTH
jgi:hypothetical protein